MDSKVEEALEFILAYAPDIVDWVVLKKELLKCLSTDRRKFFSTRHPVTKAQTLNEFEATVVERWKKLTGTDLYLGKR
jgi:hypothetical protein